VALAPAVRSLRRRTTAMSEALMQAAQAAQAFANLCSPVLSPLRTRAVAVFTFQGYISLLEAFFLAVVLYFALTRAYLPRRSREGPGGGRLSSSPDIDDAKIAAWKPGPLAIAGDDDADAPQDNRVILTSSAGPVVTVLGIDNPAVINMSSLNFLGLVGDRGILDACKETMSKYGCGACGPRGFYGTVDVHLECEAALAAMMGVDDAILYSFGSATGSSVIPAFCKKGDVVVCDKGISFALQTGVDLSRADQRWFEHNNMDDLERVLADVTAGDKANPGLAFKQRRFIIVEGIYANFGDVAPLDTIVALKNKYLFRLILDESCSLGALGKTGRGALEHFGIARSDVEIAASDLGNAFASVGGVCVGEADVVSHQRLSGAGYCFSAAQPPFLATAATEAIKVLDSRGEAIIAKCRRNTSTFRTLLDIPTLTSAGWHIDGDAASPLLHIRASSVDVSHGEFFAIQQTMLNAGVLVSAPTYVSLEAFSLKPSIRVAVSAAHDDIHLNNAARVISDVLLAHSLAR
jgi:serine palmitoyltransferase